MIAKRSDFVFGVIFILIGIVLYISTFDIRVMGGWSLSIGSEFLPKISAGAMITLGLLIALLSLKRKDIRNNQPGYIEAETEIESEQAASKNHLPKRDVIISIVLIAVYIALMDYIGFVLSTIIYLPIQMGLLAPKGEKKYVKFSIIAVTSSVVVFLLFVYVFNLRLPQGILG